MGWIFGVCRDLTLPFSPSALGSRGAAGRGRQRGRGRAQCGEVTVQDAARDLCCFIFGGVCAKKSGRFRGRGFKNAAVFFGARRTATLAASVGMSPPPHHGTPGTPRNALKDPTNSSEPPRKHPKTSQNAQKCPKTTPQTPKTPLKDTLKHQKRSQKSPQTTPKTCPNTPKTLQNHSEKSPKNSPKHPKQCKTTPKCS